MTSTRMDDAFTSVIISPLKHLIANGLFSYIKLVLFYHNWKDCWHQLFMTHVGSRQLIIQQGIRTGVR